ncbi:MAG: mechanosensitive ion channel family protein [Sphingobium sp.]
MDWREILVQLGVAVPESPDLRAIAIASFVVALAMGSGWLIRHFAERPVVRRMDALGGPNSEGNAKIVLTAMGTAAAALILLVAIASRYFSGISFILLCVALGLTVALLAFGIARRFALGGIPALLVAAIAMLFATSAAAGGLQPLLTILDSVGFSIGEKRFSILSALVIITMLIGLLLAARAANHLLSHSIGRIRTLEIGQRVLLQKLAGLAVFAVAILMAIDFVGIDLTALTVFSGAAGLAVGFGLQKTFGNLIAGLILLMDRSIKPGDVIVVSDTAGTVSKIGVRAVSVLTRDGKEHLIPNESLMTQEVENWSYSSRHVRLHIPVGVSYTSDVALAQRLMIEAAKASPRVLKQPPPTVWMTGYGDSSVDHEILAWIKDPEDGTGNVRSDILNRLWVLFADNKVEIPFPQRDIHIRSMVPVSSPE